jgi:glycosyltransferase involved in cell wall biosynthesis/LmbE family N-acetylglucosaminyl deacetylase
MRTPSGDTLMVTREGPGDRRYGLGKSLAPLVRAFEEQGMVVGYISQADLGERARMFQRRFHRLLLRLLRLRIISEESHSLAYGIMERISMGRLAAKLAARHTYRFVHCHDPVIAWGFSVFATLRRVTGVRWGVTEHGFGSYMQAFHEDGALIGTRRMRFLRRWEARILHQADWVLLPTQGCRAQLARDLSVYPIPSHWQVIPHPLPVLTSYTRQEARTRLSWETEAFYIIAVGRLAPLKNFHALVKACAALDDPSVRLVIIGDGDRTSLLTLADELGFRSCLSFAVSDDMGTYYSAADLYVSTSKTESFGLANLEALTSGLPCLCTAVGGVPDVLGNGAYLIPAEDPASLLVALRELIADPGMRARLCRRGLERAARWPKIGSIAQLYLAAYQGMDLVIGNTPKASPPRPETFWPALAAGFDHCPLPSQLHLPRNAVILVVAPHPDDEVLACGGTIALLRKNNCHVTVAIVTDGAKGDPLGYFEGNISQLRAAESKSALSLLGVEDIRFLAYPDGAFFATNQAIIRFMALVEELQPSWIFLPSPLDFHRDHVNVALAVLDAWLQLEGKNRLFFWELWQPLPATTVVNIDEVFHIKRQAANCYHLPHRYCDYLGISSQLTGYRSLYIENARQAEAFMEIQSKQAGVVIDHLLSLRAYQESVLSTKPHFLQPSRGGNQDENDPL